MNLHNCESCSCKVKYEHRVGNADGTNTDWKPTDILHSHFRDILEGEIIGVVIALIYKDSSSNQYRRVA